MSKRYSAQQKLAALNRLQANLGDIHLTSIHTGIPERTLRDWRIEFLGGVHRENFAFPPPPPPPTFVTNRESEAEQAAEPPEETELERLRREIMSHVLEIASNLTIDPESLTTRSMVLTRLIDRILKLDQAISSYIPPGGEIIQIEYKYPDGSIHNYPPFMHPDYAASPEYVADILKDVPPGEEEAALDKAWNDRFKREPYYENG